MNKLLILLFSFNLINCADIVEFDCKDLEPFFKECVYDSEVDWKKAFKTTVYNEGWNYKEREINLDFTGFEKFRTGSNDKFVTVKIKYAAKDVNVRTIYVVGQEKSGELKIKRIGLIGYSKPKHEFLCPEILVKYLCVAPWVEFFEHRTSIALPPKNAQALLGNQLGVTVEIEG
jgi:hypothetical protein